MDRGWPRTATLVAAGVQAAAAMAIIWIGSVSDGLLRVDPWRPVPLTALYLMPAVLAGLAVRARPSLLLAAGSTSLVLALAGFSLHSFVFLPVAVVYVVAHSQGERRPGWMRLAPVLLCPPLLVAGLSVLFLHDDPACYLRHGSGEVTVDRSPGDVATGSRGGTGHAVRSSIAAGSGVVGRGCTSDTVVGWEAAGSVALSGLALATALGLAPRSSHDELADDMTRQS